MNNRELAWQELTEHYRQYPFMLAGEIGAQEITLAELTQDPAATPDQIQDHHEWLERLRALQATLAPTARAH